MNERFVSSVCKAPIWQELTESLAASVRYLLCQLSPTGRFNYCYDSESRRIVKGYNLIRHSGTTMMLYRLVGTCFDRGNLAQDAARAWSYLSPYIVFMERDETPFACLAVEGIAKLGFTALSLLALNERIQRTADPDPSELDLFRRFAEYVMLQQESDGHFVSKYDLNEDRRLLFESQYYSGEAILALCAASHPTRDSRFLDASAIGAKYLIHKYEREDLISTSIFDHWLMMALNQLHRSDGETIWVDYLRLATESLLQNDSEKVPFNPAEGSWMSNMTTTQITTRVEGLLGALEVETRLGESRRAAALGNAIVSAMAYCLQRQIGSKSRPCNDPVAKGGVVQSDSESVIRIDYVQHFLGAGLGTLANLGPPCASSPMEPQHAFTEGAESIDPRRSSRYEDTNLRLG
jgi:hypothetical protein